MVIEKFKLKIMKKLLTLVLVLFFFSCETEEKVQSDIDKLKSERTVLQNQVEDYNAIVENLQGRVEKTNEELKEKKIYLSGRTPKYVLKLKLKQSHMSLDIGKHMKDAMNAIEFELPVDKELYHQVKVGSQIVDNFRSGSLIINGDFGSWKMTVVSKTMK